jgi:ketosteroid isomerase-like protein
MMTSRRSVLSAAGFSGLAVLDTASIAHSESKAGLDQTAADLATRSLEANSALVRGDIAAYRKLITLSDDFTLMAPFGGTPTRGVDVTEERWVSIGRFFRNGTLTQEVVETYSTADMVVLVLIEDGTGEVGGLPDQVWRLRVTLVFRRFGADWQLAHRHADPLVKDFPISQAAAIARR